MEGRKESPKAKSKEKKASPKIKDKVKAKTKKLEQQQRRALRAYHAEEVGMEELERSIKARDKMKGKIEVVEMFQLVNPVISLENKLRILHILDDLLLNSKYLGQLNNDDILRKDFYTIYSGLNDAIVSENKKNVRQYFTETTLIEIIKTQFAKNLSSRLESELSLNSGEIEVILKGMQQGITDIAEWEAV